MRAGRPDQIEPGEAVGEPLQGLFGAAQTVPGKVQLLAIVRRQQQVAHRRRPEAFFDHVGDGVGVAERLRHLLLVDNQILDVDPEARERPAGGAFALRDFVLVMREDEIDAAGMDVDRRLAEQPERHRRAFDVPAGTPGGDRLITTAHPAWLPSRGRSRARPPWHSCRNRRAPPASCRHDRDVPGGRRWAASKS